MKFVTVLRYLGHQDDMVFCQTITLETWTLPDGITSGIHDLQTQAAPSNEETPFCV